MTISWTGFARGNVEAAVKMTVIGLILGSLGHPVLRQTADGRRHRHGSHAGGPADPSDRLSAHGGRPSDAKPAAASIRPGSLPKTDGPAFPGAFHAGRAGHRLCSHGAEGRIDLPVPELLLSIFTPIIIIYALNFALSTLVGKRLLPRGDAIALVYGTVMRNLSIALALAINAFGTQGAGAALVIAMAYMIQVQSAAWYVKFTDRIFGPAVRAPMPAMAALAAEAVAPVYPTNRQGPES